MECYYSSAFKKQYKKLPVKIREQFKTRLMLFMEDQTDPQLQHSQITGRTDRTLEHEYYRRHSGGV